MLAVLAVLTVSLLHAVAEGPVKLAITNSTDAKIAFQQIASSIDSPQNFELQFLSRHLQLDEPHLNLTGANSIALIGNGTILDGARAIYLQAYDSVTINGIHFGNVSLEVSTRNATMVNSTAHSIYRNTIAASIVDLRGCNLTTEQGNCYSMPSARERFTLFL